MSNRCANYDHIEADRARSGRSLFLFLLGPHFPRQRKEFVADPRRGIEPAEMSGLIEFFAFLLGEADAEDVVSDLFFGLLGSASHDAIVATKNLRGNPLPTLRCWKWRNKVAL